MIDFGNQYCIYCASCLYLEGKLVCDLKDEEMTLNHAKRLNHCPDFVLSPMGHAINGKKYRPQRWKYVTNYARRYNY